MKKKKIRLNRQQIVLGRQPCCTATYWQQWYVAVSVDLLPVMCWSTFWWLLAQVIWRKKKKFVAKLVKACLSGRRHVLLSFQLTEFNFPREPIATHQSSGNVQHTLTAHTPSFRVESLVKHQLSTEVLHRLCFPTAYLISVGQPDNFLWAKPLPGLYSLIMTSTAWDEIRTRW